MIRPGTFLSIQVLRGMAALSIAVVHVVSSEFPKHYELPDALPNWGFWYAGVDMFFVISGFVIAHASEQLHLRPFAPREFFLRRLARIAPLYWIITSVILLYLLREYGNLARVNFTPLSVVASYLFIPFPQIDGAMLPVHGVGWTLNYEMFFYALFCVALLFARRTGVLLVAGILLVLVLVNVVLPLPGPLGFWADPIVLEFVFGMLIALVFGSEVRLSWPVAGAIVAVALAVIVATDFSLGGPLRPIGWGLPCAVIVGALLLAKAPERLGRGLRFLVFLGDASYALYLTNTVSVTLPRRLLPHLIAPAERPLLHAVLLLVIAVAVAALVHLVLERPLTRALQRRISTHYRGAAAS